MALTFDVSKIPDYDVNFPEQDGQWHIVTFGVVHRMMHTGVGWELTEKNAAEFYARCKFLDELSGTILLDGEGNSRPLTVDDVKKHIGITTNVAWESRASFIKRNVEYNFKTWIGEFERA
jgi:hypothetical protein